MTKKEWLERAEAAERSFFAHFESGLDTWNLVDRETGECLGWEERTDDGVWSMWTHMDLEEVE